MPLFSPYADRREEIISRVIEGLRKGTPLTVVCSAEDMPCDDTVRAWAEKDDDLARAIARARETGFDAIALEALAIADTEPEMAMGGDGSSRRDSAYVAWQKNRIETRLKLLAKWDPKRYGEMTKIANADGSNIETGPTSEVDLATRMAAMAASMNRGTDGGKSDAD